MQFTIPLLARTTPHPNMVRILLTQYFQWTTLAVILKLSNPVLGGYSIRSAYVKIIESCRLAEASNQTMFDADECKYACLAKRGSGKCTAYQWKAETRTCRLQETLNVTASSSGDSVGVLRDTDERTACTIDDNCPLNHNCHVVESECGILGKFCQAATNTDAGTETPVAGTETPVGESTGCLIADNCPADHSCIDGTCVPNDNSLASTETPVACTDRDPSCQY
jgi:hypothetical protein